jgi:hypothetical protein
MGMARLGTARSGSVRTAAGAARTGTGTIGTGCKEDNEVSAIFCSLFLTPSSVSSTPHLDHRLSVASTKEAHIASATAYVLLADLYLDREQAAAVAVVFAQGSTSRYPSYERGCSGRGCSLCRGDRPPPPVLLVGERRLLTQRKEEYTAGVVMPM